MKNETNCEYCLYYSYNQELDCYECLVDLDEDEMERFIRSTVSSCPYFKFDDEYKTVRKQM